MNFTFTLIDQTSEGRWAYAIAPKTTLNTLHVIIKSPPADALVPLFKAAERMFDQ